jgi:glycosyltransferase involved in cell wall biosynthesis
VDAVTNQGLACRAQFDSWGWEGRDYAAVLAPGIRRQAIRPLHEFKKPDSDVLLLHYSGYARGLEPVIERAQRSLLISHNITPPRYFWTYEPVEAVRCERAQAQLATIARHVSDVAAVSQFNARELTELTSREAEVIPVLFNRRSLGAPTQPKPGPPTILFVGRLVPHKRQDLVIRAFAKFRQREPAARLVLVGVPLTPRFADSLRALAEELAPGSVSFETAISADRLAEHYRSAHVFLCLSEHEGFCIPLLEAFHFGVPVIARNAGAVGEVVGDAGILLEEQDGLETIAELLAIVVADRELRAELCERGRRRLEFYDSGRAAARLRDALCRIAA